MVANAPEHPESPRPEFFGAEGEMASLMRDVDWVQTSIGPPANWPQSLKTAVRIVLTSRFSMWMGWGPDLTFFYNDAYRRDTLGLKHPWALGKNFCEVWAEVWTDLGPRVEAVLKSGQATWDEALLLFLERSGFTEETYHTFSYSPLADDEGKVAGILCVVTEETERVIGERRLALLRDLGAGVASVQTEREVLAAISSALLANPKDVPFSLTYLLEPDGEVAKLVSSTGIEPGTSLAPSVLKVGEPGPKWPIDKVLTNEGQTVVHLLDRVSIIPGGPWDKPPTQAVIVPIAQQGIERPAGFLVVGVNPYRSLDESYVGFIDLLSGQIASGLASARAYEAEKQRAEKLAELDRAKTTFFSNVSHELRTPLTLILGPLEDLLSSEDKLNGSRAQVEVAHRNGLRLLKLVNTLLDFSRLEAGRVQACFRPTDLAALTEDLTSNFRSACERAGLELVVDCPRLRGTAFVDREMWEKIILNLLSNALKHTLEGRIEVSTHESAQDVIVTVQDTGTGIPATALPHLFDRFYRVEGSAARSHEGTGIGLALVKELVHLHGGNVTATSEVGRGSIFKVTVPLGRDHLPPEQVSTQVVEQSSPKASQPFLQEADQWLKEESLPMSPVGQPATGARIIVADDNVDLRDYLVRLLSKDYLVEAVSDGQKALDAAKRELPDLILTDVMMPVVDGFGLLRALREEDALREVPLIMLSARAGEEAKVEGLEQGADDYLVKPFSARELLARVKSNLELARLRRLSALRAEKLRFAAESAYERMKEFAESLPQMVSERDKEGRLTWANERFYEYTGFPSGTVFSNGGSRVVHPDDREKFEQSWKRVFQTGENLRIEVRLRRHDGAMRWWLISTVAVRDAEGNIERFYGSATDIHDQKEAELELERRVVERTAELVAANREMEGFTYTVSHDLRSPLRSIIFNSTVLLDQVGDNLSQEHRELLVRQAQAAKKLAEVIDDLLKFSRVSRQELKLTEVDVTAVAKKIVDQIRPEARRACEFDIQQGMTALADPQLLEFVIMNLIENAVKFSPEGGCIRVGVRMIKGRSTFVVEDEGIGFDSVYSDKVFQPFERLVTEKEFPGTGIGLANVKRIVDRHRGQVWVETEPGRGAKFYFTLGEN